MWLEISSGFKLEETLSLFYLKYIHPARRYRVAKSSDKEILLK